MANFNPLDPSTFTRSDTNFSGNYSYRVSVNPADPSRYQGIPYIQVTSHDLLTEEQILATASQYIDSYSRLSAGYENLSLELVDAKINKNLLGE